MTTYVLAAVMTVLVLGVAAVIRWRWLPILGVLVALRLGPREATEAGLDGWDYERLLAVAVDDWGMPERFTRWLRPSQHQCAPSGPGDGATSSGGVQR